MHRIVATYSAIWISVSGVFAGCAPLPVVNPLPEAFGVTMVEETTCIGLGGQIVMGPNGAFCANG